MVLERTLEKMTEFALPGWGLVSVPHSSLFPAGDIPSPCPPPISGPAAGGAENKGQQWGFKRAWGRQSSSLEIRAPRAGFVPRGVWCYEVLSVGTVFSLLWQSLAEQYR